MKLSKSISIAVAIAFILAQGAWAGEAKQAASKDQHQTAVYEIPGLSVDLSKDLVKGLKGIDGILAAKPDTDAGTFAVTFASAETDADAIRSALGAVASEVALSKVGPADPKAVKKDCSKCPKKSGCPSANKDKKK